MVRVRRRKDKRKEEFVLKFAKRIPNKIRSG